MVEEAPEYEVRLVKTIRGMESRSREKIEAEGWEFVSQTQGSLRTEMSFRRAKVKRKQPLWAWGILVGVPIVLFTLLATGVFAEDEDSAQSAPTQTPSGTPRPTPSSNPTTTTPAQPQPPAASTAPAPPPPAAAIDEIWAAQFLAEQWESKFAYGGTVHWIVDRITTANADGTFTFKIGATVTNQFGADTNAVIEGDVGGTNDAPIIIDSILYSASGDVVNFYG